MNKKTTARIEKNAWKGVSIKQYVKVPYGPGGSEGKHEGLEPGLGSAGWVERSFMSSWDSVSPQGQGGGAAAPGQLSQDPPAVCPGQGGGRQVSVWVFCLRLWVINHPPPGAFPNFNGRA